MTFEALTVMGNQKKKKYSVQLPPYHQMLLIWWCYLKGDSYAGLISRVFQARAEHNLEFINEGLETLAKQQGMSLEELKQKLLDEAGYDSTQDTEPIPDDQD